MTKVGSHQAIAVVKSTVVVVKNKVGLSQIVSAVMAHLRDPFSLELHSAKTNARWEKALSMVTLLRQPQFTLGRADIIQHVGAERILMSLE